MYQEFKFANFHPAIDSIWYADSSRPDESYSVTPELTPNLVIKLHLNRSETVFSGAVTRQQTYPFIPDTHYFGVRFRPGYTCLHTQASLYELQNTSMLLPKHILKQWDCADEQLRDQTILDDKIEFLSRSIAKISDKEVDLPSSLQEALYLIHQHGGTTTVQMLSQMTMISERQLERYFKTYLGLSPKAVCNTVRIQQVLNMLWGTTQKPNLSNLAFRLGYADQSHLANDFKKIMGESISEYLTQ